MKKRLDSLLVEKDLAEDLRQARALILSGAVLVDEQPVDKAGRLIPSTATVRLKASRCRYVSRGGLKLEGALGHFGIPVTGKTCLDLGASTGGFTDCLLHHGARRVYAFDVGSGQLDWKLRQDGRVLVRENVNVKHLEPPMVEEAIHLITADLAFISLRLIFPRLRLFPAADILALVKPQFEARRREVPRGGVIRDARLRGQILDRVRDAAISEGFRLCGETPSPIKGQKGNLEQFFWLRLDALRAKVPSPKGRNPKDQ